MAREEIDSGTTGVAGMLAVLVGCTAIALLTVRDPAQLAAGANPTPYGYTWSLAFFVVPAALAAGILPRTDRHALSHRAAWLTVGLLAPLGFLLDVFFGLLFFNFENHAATSGIHLPAWDWTEGRFVFTLPVEEFGFYLFGFMAIVATYRWLDERFLSLYHRPDAHRLASDAPVVRFHGPALGLAAGLVLLALAVKALGPHPEGFPGWMIYLVVVGMTPGTGFYRTAAPFVNWRALGVTVLLMVLVSIVWEVTLGVPYRWWGYNHDQMMGLFIHAWSGLPVEQPFLWVLVSFTTVIVYETLKIVLLRRGGAR